MCFGAKPVKVLRPERPKKTQKGGRRRAISDRHRIRCRAGWGCQMDRVQCATQRFAARVPVRPVGGVWFRSRRHDRDQFAPLAI